MKKIVIASILGAILIGAYYFDVPALLTLENLHQQADWLIDQRIRRPVIFAMVYFGVYVITTAVSIPGATILTLAGGAIFGLFWGTVLVSFASATGATLAFLMSRFFLFDSVHRRFAKQLKVIDAGIQKDGAFYLFSLRLIPFPFFLVNLLMGLTAISPVKFYCVSQAGMLAGTLVYINAGTQLASIRGLGDVFSLGLLASFALLGLLPLLGKKCVDVLRGQRVYRGFNKPKRFDRNVIVIGAGAGGLVTSYIAAAVKAKVTLIESHKMGGDCLNYGCVPSKSLIKSAAIAHQMRKADRYGLVSVNPVIDFTKIAARIKSIISEVEPHDSAERYTQLGVDCVQGFARLVDPWTVSIQLENGQDRILTAKSIVLATGSKPFVPSIEGIETSGFVTSDTLWQAMETWTAPPARVLILGGGPIGTELAQALARLGSSVTQVERGSRILGKEDEDVSHFVQRQLQQDGVDLLTDQQLLRCEQDDGGRYAVLKHGEREYRAYYDIFICATGRVARLTGYGLEELGIADHRNLETDPFLATRFPNIYAVGDVVGRLQFTHVAAHQAWYAAVNSLFGRFKKFKVDYRFVPRTLFIQPEVARVGLNEREARLHQVAYEITQFPLKELDRAIVDSAVEGFIKILTVPGKDKILGVTIAAEHAGDLLAEFVTAMKYNLGLNKVLGTVHSYPTWAELNKYGAGEWKRKHAPKVVLTWLEKFHQWQRN